MRLSDRVADPDDPLDHVDVVDDQVGRLTFANDMAAAIFHLLDSHAPYGVYNLTSSGNSASWAEIAAEVFDCRNGNASAVLPVGTAEYYADARKPIATRPQHSTLDLTKADSAGCSLASWRTHLNHYVHGLAGGDDR